MNANKICLILKREQYPFDIKLPNKKTNTCGLQITDLVAHPIAQHIIRPEQPNIAFEVVKMKILEYPKHKGIGLKCYPRKRKAPVYTYAGR